MSVEFTKIQWQDLGNIIRRAGYSPDSFVRNYEDDDVENTSSVSLTERESSSKFRITPTGSQFRIDYDVPGTTQMIATGGLRWDDVQARLLDWAMGVKRENEATDPWGAEAEEMAEDDSYFSLSEIPMVDAAINKSLDDLRTKAIEHGVAQDRIETELAEIKNILVKSARTSTKKEWLTLFKGVVIEKLVDWGMKTALFQGILHVLLSSTQEIHLLAEHAARHIT